MVVLAEKKAWSPAKSVHTGSSKTGFVYVLGLIPYGVLNAKPSPSFHFWKKMVGSKPPNEGTLLVGSEALPRTSMWLAGCAVVLCVDMNFALVSSFLPQEALRRGVSGSMVGVIIASISVGSLLAATVSARVVDRFGASRVLQIALATYTAMLVLMVLPAYQVSTGGFIASCIPLRIIQGAASSFAEVSATILVIRSVSVEHIARAMGWLEAARALGQLVGPVVGGGLFEMMRGGDVSNGFWLPFVVCAGCLLLTMGLVHLLLPGHDRTIAGQSPIASINTLPVLSILPAAVALFGQVRDDPTRLDPILSNNPHSVLLSEEWA